MDAEADGKAAAVRKCVHHGNAAEAARQAGYKGKNANIVGQQNLTKLYIRNAIEKRLKEIEDAQIADAKEVMKLLTSTLRGELEEEIIVCEGRGEGVSEAVRLLKKPSIRDRLEKPSIRDRLEAAKCLMKRYGLMLSDVEIEEKKAKTAALKKDSETGSGEEVMIIDDSDTDQAE